MIFADEMLDAQLLCRRHRVSRRSTSLLLLLLLQLIFVGPRERAASGCSLRRADVIILAASDNATIGRESPLVIVFAARAVETHFHKNIIADVGGRRQSMISDAATAASAIERHSIGAAAIAAAVAASTAHGVTTLHRVLTQLDHLVVELCLFVAFILRPHRVHLSFSRASLPTEDEDDDDENDESDDDAETDYGHQLRGCQRIVVVAGVGSARRWDFGSIDGRRGNGSRGHADVVVILFAIESAVAGIARALVETLHVGARAMHAGISLGAFVDVHVTFFSRESFGAFAFEAAGDVDAGAAVGARHQRTRLQRVFTFFADETFGADAREIAAFFDEAGAAVGARLRVADALTRLAITTRISRRALTR